MEVSNSSQSQLRKRGRPPRAQPKQQPVAKKSKEVVDDDEDVCFICFDGGSLVLCDRKGCPKAYHPACIKRDEAFFRSKAKWNCEMVHLLVTFSGNKATATQIPLGWHICSMCEKTAHHMCYTCTYSLCKGCIKKSDYVCVRDKGFCTGKVDFDDKTSWEYLFKVYWVYLKGNLSLTLDELTQAKNPWKISDTIASIEPTGYISASGRRSITAELSLGNMEANESKRRKTDEQTNGLPKESPSIDGPKEWASKELLDFVAHMKNGDTSVLSQFDVQALLLEYIKRNNLRDPRKKTQISLIEDREKFHEKVVGSIVQIRISGSDQKDDMYRLVQVVGDNCRTWREPKRYIAMMSANKPMRRCGYCGKYAYHDARNYPERKKKIEGRDVYKAGCVQVCGGLIKSFTY
ncbi:zinc finger, PHD-type, SWIB/MDM2 domain, Plus-3 domain, Zinc finger, RING/FYVE/PHD-type [Artemisia annua]|uniref:Zinc finger, PHD-type, SWIB/MDM2 domain, Plus-3 domain, Zinc finger, RING/FYVE/PHD-type n=1 Tax=Artemisia annua TaxID=35608 RepID=A0A2U1LTF8_ARTAN|nr:zinc finger, PHD-type, SWIB/MDM2 domain, Plus-3 domain, Zinc finger, RING/FYVE/PHD-type [Artemisia annua]